MRVSVDSITINNLMAPKQPLVHSKIGHASALEMYLAQKSRSGAAFILSINCMFYSFVLSFTGSGSLQLGGSFL